jgi:hypothetical protein
MTRIPFKLVENGESTAPNDGQELGDTLAKAADLLEADWVAKCGGLNRWRARGIFEVLNLAADAFNTGASRSIGHNRADRYMAKAKELRARAEKLIADNPLGS